ncbi:hypothetical protein STVA_06490 [Allostella vacuolata]|nr:hypothetical protein STVA_06490 [Stella vacuolata]
MPTDRLEGLIVGLYDAALDGERWSSAFAEMRGLVDAETSISSIVNPTRGEVHLLASNAPEAFLRGYQETWWPKDLWMIEAARRAGRISVGSEMVPDAEFVRSEVFNELVRPTSDVRDVLGIVFDIQGWRGVVGLHRTVAGTFGQAEKQIVGALVPHLVRSLDVTLRFEELAKLNRASQAAVDAFAFGVVIADARCRVMMMNRFAAEILAQKDGLSGGTTILPITAERPADTMRLHRLVAGVSGPAREAGGALRVARRGGRPDLELLVSPLAGQRAHFFNAPRPGAMLIIQDPQRLPVPPARILRDLYGLTAAEAEIVIALAAGHTPEEVAEARQVAVSTMRTQLRSILAKTGAGRLTQLARMIASLPGLREAGRG